MPPGRGRGTADILAAAAGDQAEGARVRALVVLGADPLTDFPDRRLAGRAIEGAEFVVAVASTPGALLDHADVVLPAAEAHERRGTTTNIEGRISRVGQKLVPPGQAWPDWMIASELAVHLGSDPGFDSVGAVWDEIERVAVSHRGITRAVLDALGSRRRGGRPLSLSPVSLTDAASPVGSDGRARGRVGRATGRAAPGWSRRVARRRERRGRRRRGRRGDTGRSRPGPALRALRTG